ncbi:hypothetical protein Agub_g9549, partial [Astrephomene gubernaculifera]
MQLGVRLPAAWSARRMGMLPLNIGPRCPAHPRCAPVHPRLTPCKASGGGKDPKAGGGAAAQLRRLAQQAEQHLHRLVDCMTPKQQGDLADVGLVLLSTLVLTWLAAALYSLYAFAFFSSGQQTMGAFFGAG